MTDRDFEAGASPSDTGIFSKEMEADRSVFESERPRLNQPVDDESSDESNGLQGPGGDSRPDETDPRTGEFVSLQEHPMMTTVRDANGPEIRKEDPEFLEAHRVDQEDEIVGRPNLETGSQEAILRPRKSKQGDESEGI